MPDTIPGDSSTTLTLQPDTPLSGNLEQSGDADWFRANLVAGWGYQIDLEGVAHGRGTLFDPYLSLYDADSHLLAENDDSDSLDSFLYFVPTADGLYFLGAEGAGPEQTGTYLIRLTRDELDSTATAATIEPGSAVTGTLGYGQDAADWRSITLVAGHPYLFELAGVDDTGAGTPAIASPWLGLHDSTGALVTAAGGSGDASARILFVPTESGTYYLDAQTLAGDAGSYRLTTDASPLEGTVSLGSTVQGSLDAAGEEDLYLISLEAGTFYDIALDGITLADPLLEFMTTSGSVILSDDNASGLNSRLSFMPTMSGTFLLGVRESGNDATGTYSLRVSTHQFGDGFEHNDLPEHATPMGVVSGSIVLRHLSIGMDDVDYFRFTLSAEGRSGDAATIDFNQALGDLDLALYDATGTTLLRHSAGSTGQERIALAGLAAGDYILQVSGFNGATNDDYSLTVTANPLVDGADRLEQDDTPATATSLGIIAGTVTHEGLSVQANDPDWFRFVLAGTGREGDAVTVNFTDALGDVDVDLYGPGGTTLIASSAGTDDVERISLAGMVAGEYYVRVRGYNGAANPDYSISISAAPQAVAADRFEQNDTYLTATVLGSIVGTRTEAHLTAESNDADWYRFTLSHTGRAGDYAKVSFTHVLGDIDLALVNVATQTIVATSTTTSNEELVSLAGLAAGDYLLVVGGLNGASNPDYTLSVNVAPPAVPADRFEQNDTAATATSLGTLSGERTESGLTMEPSDPDWYRFTLGSAGRAGDSISASFTHAQGDIDMQLYDASGTQLLLGSYGSGDGESISLAGLAAGQYTLRVYGYNGAGNPGYSLKFSAPPPVTPDRLEQNDTPASAYDLRTIINTVSRYNLSIDAGDPDWYRFTLPGTGQSGDMASVSFNHAQGDIDIELWNATGTTRLASSTGVGNTEQISLAGYAAGSYLLRVYGYHDASNPSYDLSIKAAPAIVAPDRFENNDTPGTATNLRTLNGPQLLTDLTVQSNESDWYQFTIGNRGRAGEGATLYFDGDAGDVDLQLYNASGTTVLKSSLGTGDTEGVSFEGLAAGTYLLRVYGAGNQSNPNYAMLLNAAPPVPGPDALENNDSMYSPTNLREISGFYSRAGLTIQSGDDDWYEFSFGEKGRWYDYARIDFTHAQGDLDMYLYTADGTLISSSTSTTNSEQISLEGLSGTYLLRVTGYHGAQSPGYTLSISGPPPVSPDAWEYNDTFATATQIRTQETTISGATLSAFDSDFYEFTLAQQGGSGDRVLIRADRPGVALRLYDGSGNLRDQVTTDAAGQAMISLYGREAGHWYADVERTSQAPQAHYDLDVRAKGAASKNGWTVMVFMNGDNNLEGSAIGDLNEMEEALNRSGVDVLVGLDRIPGYETGYGRWTDTRGGYVSHDNDTSSIFSALDSWGEWDMGDPRYLTAFINWAAEEAPANHYMLVMWDHGGGALSGVSFDDSSGNNLSLAQLRQAIEASNLSTIDIVGFDACLMSSVEMASELDGVANYVVGSELTEPGDGWDYSSILGYLRSSSTASGLAGKIVDSYVSSYGGAQHLAATSLSGVGALEDAIDAFVSVMDGATAADWRAVVNARARTKTSDAGFDDYADLGHFMRLVKAQSSNATLDAAAQSVIDAVANAVVRSGGPANLYGMTIVFPKRGESLDSTYTSSHFDFLSGTRWKSFLDKYLSVSLPSTASYEPGSPDFAESLGLDGRETAYGNDLAETAYALGVINGRDFAVRGLSLDAADDEDWFTFTLPAGEGRAPALAVQVLGSVAGVRAQLLDAAGTLIAEATSTAAAPTLDFGQLAAGGTYLLHVNATGATDLPLYELHFDAFGPSAAVTALPDLAEAAGGNDSAGKGWQAGTATQLVQTGGIANLSLDANDIASGAGGGDWFRIDSARVTQANANIVELTDVSNDAASLVIRVYDLQGNLVAQSDAPGDLSVTFAPLVDDVLVQVQSTGAEPVRGYTLRVLNDRVAPTVDHVELSATGAVNQTLNAGDVLTATVSFSEAVFVSGQPSLQLQLGAGTAGAAYVSGSGTSTLVFSYTVMPGDTDGDGVSIGADALRLTAGTLRDAAGNAAQLSHPPLADDPAFKVDTLLQIVASSPADHATSVPVGSNIALSFGELVQLGTGTIVLEAADGSVVESFDIATSPRVSLAGGTLTLDPSADLVAGAAYRLEVGAGIVTDRAGNALAPSTYAFTTLLDGQSFQGAEGDNAMAGTPGNDSFSAQAGNDTITGGAGDDFIDGGAGLDLAVFHGALAAYTIRRQGDSSTVTVRGPDGSDTLVDVERMQFDDYYVALDIHGNGGRSFRLYQAAFNRAPDLAGLGFHMHDLDEGVPLWVVATHFIQSPEFLNTYGNLDNAGYVQQLYRNVLHRDAEQAGLAFHTANLDAGLARHDLLIQFSESPENQANVIGTINDGMPYVLI